MSKHTTSRRIAPAAMLLFCASTAFAQGLGIKTSGPDNSLTNVAAFEAWIGAPINYRISFVDQSTWSSNTNPWFLSTTQAWLAQSPNHYEVMGVGLVPNSNPRDFASVINGSHDADFRNLGTVLTNAGVAIARTAAGTGSARTPATRTSTTSATTSTTTGTRTAGAICSTRRKPA